MTTQFVYRFNIIFAILFAFCPIGIFGFLPPMISEKIIVSNLETIISTNAISSSLFKSLRREIDIERAVLQFVPMHISSGSGYIYVSIVLTVLYGQWKFHSGSQLKYDKLRKIDRFNRIEMFIKNIMFLIILVLLRDVESAS
jgi:hypothetical protein